MQRQDIEPGIRQLTPTLAVFPDDKGLLVIEFKAGTNFMKKSYRLANDEADALAYWLVNNGYGECGA
jgi:hypothetical protein